MNRLAKPDPGTHWQFYRGDNPFLTGPIPTFDLVDDATGRQLGQVFINTSFTQFGVWLDSYLTIRVARRQAKRERMLDQLETPVNGGWEVKRSDD